ncbi:Cytochrome P450 1A1 [Trichinella pseudospiralis]
MPEETMVKVVVNDGYETCGRTDTWLWQTMNGYGFYLAMPAGRCIIWNVKLVHSGKENFVSPESSAEK